MAKQELFERSPIRAFDEVTNGGLKAGEMGLITSKKGLGKTSVLVQFGMDTLLNNKQLIHVSFDQKSANVITWYDEIYNEISKKKSIAPEIKEQITHNRTVLNFNQDNINLERVVTTLNALKTAGINVAGVVIDDVDFSKVKEADIASVANFAKVAKVKVWISSTATGDKLADQAPKSILPYFSTVVHLVGSKAAGTQLQILKTGKKGEALEETLKIDSKTMLISAK